MKPADELLSTSVTTLGSGFGNSVESQWQLCTEFISVFILSLPKDRTLQHLYANEHSDVR